MRRFKDFFLPESYIRVQKLLLPTNRASSEKASKEFQNLMAFISANV